MKKKSFIEKGQIIIIVYNFYTVQPAYRNILVLFYFRKDTTIAFINTLNNCKVIWSCSHFVVIFLPFCC